MASRFFLLRDSLHRRAKLSSQLLQNPQFRSLLTSPESHCPYSATPLSIRRGYHTAGFPSQRYPSSNGVENAATSRPRKKENNAGKNGYGYAKAKKPAFATNVYHVVKKPLGRDQAAKRSPEKVAAKWSPVKEAAKWSPVKETTKWSPVRETGEWAPVKEAAKWSPVKEADKWSPENEAAQRSPEKGGDESGLEEMKRKLLALENEVKVLKDNAITGSHLRTEKRDGIAKVRPVNGGNPQEEDKPVFTGPIGDVFKCLERKVSASTEVKLPLKEVKLSEEALAMLERLREDGLLKGMCLCEDEKVMPERLQIASVQKRLRHVSEKFAVLHQDIAKFLSESDLKNVALFGCPSIEKKIVTSAKKLRNFFKIQEDTVCGSCKLKSSCKFANRIVREDKLMLTDALRVLMAYSFYGIPPQIQIPSEMEDSITKLLKQVVNHSKEGSSV